MLGPEGLAVAIQARLQQDLPARLATIRGRLGIPAEQLPVPTAVEITETETASIERFPLIVVVPLQTNLDAGTNQYASGGGFNAYEYRYDVAIWVWVRGQSKADTQRRQWRTTLAVRECLIAKRGYGNPDGPDFITIDPNRVAEAYSDVESDPQKRWIAGTQITAEFTTQEHLPAIQPAVGIQQGNPLAPVTQDVTAP